MVIKPIDGLVQERKGLLPPAIKCRGREYLRIIYGPTYTEPANLDRLRLRLRLRGSEPKRALVRPEFMLRYEALHRLNEHEPLYREYECVFGVLALRIVRVDPWP